MHPSGIPHGPHPGAYERSIGKKKHDELAVMVDTFAPLKLTQSKRLISEVESIINLGCIKKKNEN